MVTRADKPVQQVLAAIALKRVAASQVACKHRQRLLGTVPEQGHCVLCVKVVDDYSAKVTCRLELYVCCECMSARPEAAEAAIALLRSLKTQDRDLLSVTARATAAAYEWWSDKLRIRESLPPPRAEDE